MSWILSSATGAHLGYVNAGVIVNLGLLHHNIVLTVTDVGNVTFAEVPCLDPAHIKEI